MPVTEQIGGTCGFEDAQTTGVAIVPDSIPSACEVQDRQTQEASLNCTMKDGKEVRLVS